MLNVNEPNARAKKKKIYVIIASLNEEENIKNCIQSCEKADSIIISDAGSSDDTVKISKNLLGGECVFIASERGRAKQFNQGAKALMNRNMFNNSATWGDEDDVFVFLHADTRLPKTFREDIKSAFEREDARRIVKRKKKTFFPQSIVNAFKPKKKEASVEGAVVEENNNSRWGAFPIELSGKRELWKTIVGNLANFRTSRTGVPYGDQAVFVTRSAFDLHKFDETKTFMEDYEYSQRLKRAFGKPALVKGNDSKVVTDARRFEKIGFVSTTTINMLCVIGYHLKIDVNVLGRFYHSSFKR